MPKIRDPFAELAPAAKRVAKARAEVGKAQRDLREVILAARKKGHTLQQIADEVGLSYPRIHQIINSD